MGYWKAQQWSILVLALAICLPGWAVELQMDTDEQLIHRNTLKTRESLPQEPFQGSARKQIEQPKQPDVLKIQVKTFQDAVVAERDTVNWYAWYLSIRSYLDATGGLNVCGVGTPIKIYKQGRIEALSPNLHCRASVGWRKFPLPEKTQLGAVILPVRSGNLPPASPEELQMRLRQSRQVTGQ